jgi:hypothetical protein
MPLNTVKPFDRDGDFAYLPQADADPGLFCQELAGPGPGLA